MPTMAIEFEDSTAIELLREQFKNHEVEPVRAYANPDGSVREVQRVFLKGPKGMRSVSLHSGGGQPPAVTVGGKGVQRGLVAADLFKINDGRFERWG